MNAMSKRLKALKEELIVNALMFSSLEEIYTFIPDEDFLSNPDFSKNLKDKNVADEVLYEQLCDLITDKILTAYNNNDEVFFKSIADKHYDHILDSVLCLALKDKIEKFESTIPSKKTLMSEICIVTKQYKGFKVDNKEEMMKAIYFHLEQGLSTQTKIHNFVFEPYEFLEYYVIKPIYKNLK